MCQFIIPPIYITRLTAGTPTRYLCCSKTYQELTALAGCPDVAQLYLDFIRDRFKAYSDHSIKVYEANLVRWKAKTWDGSCKETEAMTEALKAAKPTALDIGEFFPPLPHCLAG